MHNIASLSSQEIVFPDNGFYNTVGCCKWGQGGVAGGQSLLK